MLREGVMIWKAPTCIIVYLPLEEIILPKKLLEYFFSGMGHIVSTAAKACKMNSRPLSMSRFQSPPWVRPLPEAAKIGENFVTIGGSRCRKSSSIPSSELASAAYL